VSNDCAIDMPAGPTEVLILATGGESNFIARICSRQAEHDPDAVALLVRLLRGWLVKWPRNRPAASRAAEDQPFLEIASSASAISLRHHWIPRFDC